MGRRGGLALRWGGGGTGSEMGGLALRCGGTGSEIGGDWL